MIRERRHTENLQRRLGCLAVIVIYAVAAVAAVLLLCQCGRTTYVPVESVRTEYRDRDVERFVTDTVHDTRFVWVKGDTLVDIREKERIRRVEIHDTAKVILTDTIRVPYPVEKKLTRWERTKQDVGGMALGALALVLCAAVLWLIKKFRK